jgi:hypothetical protein
MTGRIIAGAFFVGSGVLVLGVAGLVASWSWDLVRSGAVAEGQVTELNAGGSHPQIEFHTSDGRSVSYPQDGLISGYRPGDRVRVYYRTADPNDDPCIDSTGALWGPTILIGLIGAAHLIGGIITIVLARIRARLTP